MSNDLVKYNTDRGEITLSPQIIRNYLVPSGTNVTDQEVIMFLNLCRYQGLNPFLREVYLVKYGNNPASIVTGKEVFTKRAMMNPLFAGLEAGITVQHGDKVARREGSLLLQGEVLLGGWAKVHLKEHAVPFYDEVSFGEYSGTGPLWKSKPATMIRKVAIVHALREAFPEQFEGLYSPEEINTVDASKLPEKPVVIPDEPYEPNVVPVADTDGVVYADAIDVTPEPEPPTVQPKAAPAQTQKVNPGDYIFPIGTKHKGQTVRHIYESDKGYLEWYVQWENAKEPTLGNVKYFLAFPDILAKEKPAVTATKPKAAPAKQDDTRLPLEAKLFPGDDQVPLPFDMGENGR